jgi:hypothetical protein
MTYKLPEWTHSYTGLPRAWYRLTFYNAIEAINPYAPSAEETTKFKSVKTAETAAKRIMKEKREYDRALIEKVQGNSRTKKHIVSRKHGYKDWFDSDKY